MEQLYAYIHGQVNSGGMDRKAAEGLLQLLRSAGSSGITRQEGEPIAVIGLAARMPGAEDYRKFWSNLRNGTDFIGQLPESRRRDAQYLLDQYNLTELHPAAFLDEIDTFDYRFFDIPPMEAAFMNPAQRLSLETVHHALEDAGYVGPRIKGTRTGLFIGSNDYYFDYLMPGLPGAVVDEPMWYSYASTGNVKSYLARRISYYFDLRGPGVLIDTACASSLTAIHLACQSIANGECEMALAGGISLFPFYQVDKGKGNEPVSGRFQAFDEHAEGVGIGEGVGFILLKPLSRAVRDGDHIYSVLLGSAINQNGSSIGLVAPSAAAQEDVLVKAWNNARIDPTTLSYMEAQGSGTALGDSIEIEGLHRAFRRYTNRQQFCALGTARANAGSAGGIAGMIQAILALKNKELPPIHNLNQPARHIDFANSPVYINDRLSEWSTTDANPRRCGVSAFGLGGTNCHIVLEEAPPVKLRSPLEQGGYLVTVSAKSLFSLDAIVQEYSAFIAANEPDPGCLCYTANVCKNHYSHRLAIWFQDLADLRDKLHHIEMSGYAAQESMGIYYGMHKIVWVEKLGGAAGDLSPGERDRINEEISRILNGSGNIHNRCQIEEIARLYVLGGDVDWRQLYSESRHVKISLPAYVYDRRRCWVSNNNGEITVHVPHEYESQAIPADMGAAVNGADQSDELHMLIAELVGDIIQIDANIAVDQELFMIGLNSIGFIRLIIELELRLNITISDDDLLFENFSTIQKIISHVERVQAGPMEDIVGG